MCSDLSSLEVDGAYRTRVFVNVVQHLIPNGSVMDLLLLQPSLLVCTPKMETFVAYTFENITQVLRYTVYLNATECALTME